MTIERPARDVTTVSPATIREKNSGGPKFRAIWATQGPKIMSMRVAKVPATNEPMAAAARAGPPRPFFAISYPSRQVTTLEDSPGVLTRIEVVEPPYIAP